MLSKFNFISLRFVCSTALLCAVGLGCERPIAERHYTEIFVDAEKKAMRRSNDFSRMPQDDIHAKIMSPDASDSQAMPQDDIHSKLMPQDEIHAGLKAQNMPGADMMGGMQDPALQQQINASADQTPLTWETPQEWIEKKGSGLRLATFSGTDPKAMVEVTIISLGGSAGGMIANVTRWMQQIQIDVPAKSDLENFISRQEKFSTTSDLPAQLIDFTQLQGNAGPDVPSMIAAIVERGDTQIFVKMTGSKQAVLQNRDRLKALAKSIKVKE
ncbi:MAG: hypothetical protein A2787_01135 [Omnitrophica WOR_2 bacterium RIFCSPHIGHO2_01_FULL_48_9]|nr:MAG: hypothetical protein A2787_01135 [Omnitrophica WOR_2 bacterium RIFCSPHIGHO2_01_FULL_48_9]